MDRNKLDIVILISANTEWQIVKDHFKNKEISTSPFGEWFKADLVPNQAIIFFQSGWGKILASSSTQYVIDQWSPNLIINIGTCGGFQGCVEIGTIILVNKTIVYDIIEQMGDQAKAIDFYSTNLDLSWLNPEYPIEVIEHMILSADRDIVSSEVPTLKQQFNGIVADWESGAIAYVAKRNNIKCLILRGVTDLVGMSGGEAYDGSMSVFKERSKHIMDTLVLSLSQWISLNHFGEE